MRVKRNPPPQKKNRAWKLKMNPQEQKIPFRNHHSWAPGLFLGGASTLELDEGELSHDSSIKVIQSLAGLFVVILFFKGL